MGIARDSSIGMETDISWAILKHGILFDSTWQIVENMLVGECYTFSYASANSCCRLSVKVINMLNYLLTLLQLVSDVC